MSEFRIWGRDENEYVDLEKYTMVVDTNGNVYQLVFGKSEDCVFRGIVGRYVVERKSGMAIDGEELYENDVVYVAGSGNAKVSLDPILGFIFKKSDGSWESAVDVLAENDLERKIGTIHDKNVRW